MIRQLILISLGSILLLAACQNSPEVNCSRAYIILDDDDAIREYEKYYPVAQGFGYYYSEAGMQQGDQEYIYQFDHNIFIYRSEEFAKERGVSFSEYLNQCAFEQEQPDTVFLLKFSDGKYTEYRTKARRMLRKEDSRIFLVDNDQETLLVDFELEQGDQVVYDNDRRLEVRNVNEFECHEIFQATHFTGEDSVNLVFIEGVGMMQRRDTTVDFRLAKVNDLTIAQILTAACED